MALLIFRQLLVILDLDRPKTVRLCYKWYKIVLWAGFVVAVAVIPAYAC